MEVALIAIARKVIILDLKLYSELTLLGIAALILALAVAYALLEYRLTLKARDHIGISSSGDPPATAL